MDDLLTQDELDSLLADIDERIYEKDLPIFVYVRHIDTDDCYLKEAGEELTYIIGNGLTLKKLNTYFNETYNEDILSYSPNKTTVLNFMKDRYLELIKNQKEFNALDKLFEDNPELLV
jgi:hypothetical protein